MSQAALRSVSPMHIRYMLNMGVGSTLTVSILVNDRLWGLIACHHREPTQLPLRLRRAFHSLSVTVSYMVSALEQKRLLQASNSVAAAQSLVLDAFSQTQLDFDRIIEHAAAALLKLGNATGGAFWQGGKCYPFGRWLSPERGEAVLAAVRQALPAVAEELYCSERLTLTPALAGSELRQVCGVAALSLDAFANSGIVWLRPEWRREIAWGGDPDKAMQIETDEQGQPRLTPRNSFARWETTVSGQSRAWSEFDRESLLALRALRQVLIVRESLSQVLLSDRQFRSLVTLQSDAYWQTDRQSRLLVLSKPLRFGQSGGDAVDLIALFRENGASQLQIDTLGEKFVSRRPFRDFLLTGRSVSDGDFFAYEMNGEPIFDRDHAICGMHGTLRDVTESRRYEEKLRDAQRVSEAASVAKSQFLATMSHELRTPLNVIMGRFQIIELRTDNAELRENARLGLRSSQHLLSLINDILDFSSIEAGALNITRDQPMTLAEVMLEAVESSRRYERGSTRLRFDAASMPAQRLLGDPLRLKQVLINLIGNALKFTESGDVLIAVRVLDDSESEMRVEFSVRDSGIGMNESQLAGLFLPFRQADMSIRRRFGGSGLGLAISQRLIGLMGGRIQAESEPGVGSRFWFSLTFPVAPENSVVAEPVADAPALLAGRNVLIVDDDPECLLVAAQLLSVCGAQVRCALNGREALTVAATAPVPDVIFMDMQMPGMTGPEATARLREQGHTGPIVALTAHAFAADRDTCLAAGMNAVLTKPLLLDPLLAVVEPLLEDRTGAPSPAG